MFFSFCLQEKTKTKKKKALLPLAKWSQKTYKSHNFRWRCGFFRVVKGLRFPLYLSNSPFRGVRALFSCEIRPPTSPPPPPPPLPPSLLAPPSNDDNPTIHNEC